jgi:uncharacterized protein YbbK (DUF523 family)
MDLVSACLVGIRCRYDRKHKRSAALYRRFIKHHVLPVCPEQLGGLPTPRQKAQIQTGSGADVLRGRARVMTEDGQDVTQQFVRGAREVLRIARVAHCATAYLKQQSPSCGCGRIKRDKKIVRGHGVTAALLRQAGIVIIPVS